MSTVEMLWNELDRQLLPLLRGYRDNLAMLEVSEKSDHTLLSEADLAAQTTICNTIREYFPESGFVAEEADANLPRSGDPVWVVDPIDGTSQFVSTGQFEFCSVVCLLEAGVPTAAYVLAPELGTERSPISVHWTERVTVNGKPAEPMPTPLQPRRASVTRSSGAPERPFERELAAIGCDMKLRTTSQTLDMVRTCIDLTPWTQAPQHQFDLFYRARQKVWDGAAGIGLCRAMGHVTTDRHGHTPLPLTGLFLSDAEPTFPDTVAGSASAVSWFLERLTDTKAR